MQHVYDRYPSTRNGIFSSTVRPRVAWAQKAKNSCHFVSGAMIWVDAM